jgi:hypothetical protein
MIFLFSTRHGGLFATALLPFHVSVSL